MMLERGDYRVLHEPFSHVADFGVSNVAGVEVRSEPDVVERLLELAHTDHVFAKDTTDFRYPHVLTHERFLRDATHTFMIRDPAAAIASHYRVDPSLTRDAVGFERLHEIFSAVRAATGSTPAVIDGDELAISPTSVVRAYCARVGIPFLESALCWEPTVLPAWERAHRWHAEVARSRGFEPSAAAPDIDVENHPVLSEFLRFQRPHYEELRTALLTSS